MKHRFIALKNLGLKVVGVDYMSPSSANRVYIFVKRILYWLFRHNLGNFKLLDLNNTNRRIIEVCDNTKLDVVWLDKAIMVEKCTLQYIKNNQPNCLIVGFSHDDMMQRHNQSKQFLEHVYCYDYFFTTKSYNEKELKSIGCKNVAFVDNSYSPAVHYPDINNSKNKKYLVGFIGFWEKERANSFYKIAQSGIRVHIWGSGWENISRSHPNLIINHGDIRGDEYSQVIRSMKIGLCMLRKMNRDLQTTRSVEIPACGTFMLGERTVEHQKLFSEGVEADYFSSDDELLKKVQYYLENQDEREKIALAGYRRCLTGGYSNEERLNKIFMQIT